jgi:MipA family protein
MRPARRRARAPYSDRASPGLKIFAGLPPVLYGAVSRVFDKRTLFLLGLALLPALARADTQPVWEVGAGVGAIDFPQYRGSSERRVWVLPVPYFTYNGPFLKVTRQSARGLLFRTERVEMDVSLGGSVPSSSTAARAGMPGLDATFEIGPQLQYHLYYDAKKETNVDLRLPVRPAIATDFAHFRHIGWVFEPVLNLDLKDLRRSGWNLGLSTGPVYADRGYNSYFYSVAPQYATASRAAYAAPGGYSGYQFTFALSKRFPGYWTGGFVKWDDLGRAVFADSPLVTARHSFTFGWAITWMIGKSDQTVEVSND